MQDPTPATSRERLHAELKALMPTGATNNVYFQPPPSLQLNYPCIVYSLDRMQTRNADNLVYSINDGYQVTYITKSPVDVTPKNIIKHFPMVNFNRQYINDGLYHNTFIIYY